MNLPVQASCRCDDLTYLPPLLPVLSMAKDSGSGSDILAGLAFWRWRSSAWRLCQARHKDCGVPAIRVMLLMIRTPQSVNAWNIDPAMKSVNENDYCFLAAGHHALYALPGLVWQVGELQSSPELLAADALAIPSAFRIQGEFADTVKGHRQVDLQSPGPVQLDGFLAQQHQTLGVQINHTAE